MHTIFVVLLACLLSFQSCSCHEEPKCSKYDFEEKVLEKVVRFEHKMEIMTNSINEISTKVTDDIHKMKANIKDLTENIQAEWTGIKKEFELMKNAVVEQEKMLNDTIQESIGDLSGILANCRTLGSSLRNISFYACRWNKWPFLQRPVLYNPLCNCEVYCASQCITALQDQRIVENRKRRYWSYF